MAFVTTAWLRLLRTARSRVRRREGGNKLSLGMRTDRASGSALDARRAWRARKAARRSGLGVCEGGRRAQRWTATVQGQMLQEQNVHGAAAHSLGAIGGGATEGRPRRGARDDRCGGEALHEKCCCSLCARGNGQAVVGPKDACEKLRLRAFCAPGARRVIPSSRFCPVRACAPDGHEGWI